MAGLHEILISFFIAGFVILAVLSLQHSLHTQTVQSQLMVSAQQSAALLYAMILQDFRQMGFGCDPPRSSIQSMNAQGLRFQADLDRDGDLEEVEYALSDPSAAAGSPNPDDRLLYRTVDDEAQLASTLGVTGFTLSYFDDEDQPTSVPSEVTSIGIRLSIQSTFDYDGFYGRAELETRITPKTLAQRNW